MRPLVFAAIAALAAAPAFAQQPAAAPQPAATSGGNLQDDAASWISDPHIHAFYALTVQTFAAGDGRVDEAAYTQKAFALFRQFAVARGVPPEQMVEHLKLIPGQVLGIVRQDPGVLDSYAAFTAALFGPP